MKIKTIKKIPVLVLLILVYLSCTDDFVDRNPVYSIDSENYFNSEDDFNNGLIAAYDLLQSLP